MSALYPSICCSENTVAVEPVSEETSPPNKRTLISSFWYSSKAIYKSLVITQIFFKDELATA